MKHDRTRWLVLALFLQGCLAVLVMNYVVNYTSLFYPLTMIWLADWGMAGLLMVLTWLRKR